MSPHGCASRKNPRSSSVSAGPDTAVMKARIARRVPCEPWQGQARLLISLNDAGTAGRFQVGAQLDGLLPRGERADQGPVVGAFGAEIGAADDRRVFAELAGESALHRLVGRLRFGFAAL